MKAFERAFSIPLSGRIVQKPREKGITMVVDEGLGFRAAQDLVEVAADYIDIIKLGFATSRLVDRDLVKRKVALYREHEIDVMPGGTSFEIAVAQNSLDEFLEEAEELGFSMIEVSDETVTMSDERRFAAIRAAREHGFKVVSEVMRKPREGDLTGEVYAEGIKRDLREGVFKVVVKARGGGEGAGIYDESGEVRASKLDAIVKSVNVDDLIFEAPLRNQQVYLILKFGPNVNLGNIHPEDVIPCECLRQGLRRDTLRTVYK